jgi:hypothetical protein
MYGIGHKLEIVRGSGLSAVHSHATTLRDQAKRETKTRAHAASRREIFFHLDPSTAYAPFINRFSTDAPIDVRDAPIDEGVITLLTRLPPHTTLEFR